MTSSRVLVALLCFTTWVSVVQATHAPLSSCDCVGWSTRTVNPRRVVNYTLQTEPACRINAVVFQLRGGGRICSDPNSNWAKKVILKVNEELKQSQLQRNRQKEDASTSAASPAPPHRHRLTSAVSPAPLLKTMPQKEMRERKETPERKSPGKEDSPRHELC